jgi:hypothetical protein
MARKKQDVEETICRGRRSEHCLILVHVVLTVSAPPIVNGHSFTSRVSRARIATHQSRLKLTPISGYLCPPQTSRHCCTHPQTTFRRCPLPAMKTQFSVNLRGHRAQTVGSYPPFLYVLERPINYLMGISAPFAAQLLPPCAREPLRDMAHCSENFESSRLSKLGLCAYRRAGSRRGRRQE